MNNDIRWIQRFSSFKNGLIEDGEIWLKMIKSRNLSSHSYDEFCKIEKRFLELD